MMSDQDLESRPLLAEPSILSPGAPQRQIGAGLQLGPGDQAAPTELGDLLGIGQIRLLAAELPGLANPEGRQRIDDHVPLAPSPEDIRHRLPHVPGRLEGEHATPSGAAEGCRHGAPEQFLEPHPRVRDLEPGQPLTVGGQHDDLVLDACQVQADDHIITPEAASIVRHVGPSFVSGQTREGITRTGRRCRLPLSHTLILDNGSEFVNACRLGWCRRRGIRFTRGRPYRKNDQAWVEPRNGLLVRRLVGYDRYSARAACTVLQRLYDLLRLQHNFFRPVRKLIHKHRIGSRVHKQYDAAQTPYQRVLAAAALPADRQQALAAQWVALDPIALARDIHQALDALWKLADTRSPRQ